MAIVTSIVAPKLEAPCGPPLAASLIRLLVHQLTPVHPFYQGWQQADCSIAYATHENPSGCLHDLFAWVEVSIGAGSDGNPQPAGFNDQTTGEGSTASGFYNTNIGEVAYFTKLAKKYAISDNYHQPAHGGTGLNSIFLGYGDALYYTDGHGNATVPPTNQIENPDPCLERIIGTFTTATAAAPTATAPIQRSPASARS